MRTLFFATTVVFLLSGCLTDNMEKITKDTKASVDKSGKDIKDAVRLARLQGAMEVFDKVDGPAYMRQNAAETILTLADEDRVAKYVAAFHQFVPVVAKIQIFEVQVEEEIVTVETDIPNVSLIGNYFDPQTHRTGMTDDYYNIFSKTICEAQTGLIDQLIDAAKKPGTSGETWEDLNFKARRVSKVATLLAGAMQLSTVSEMLRQIQAGRSVKEARKYEVSFPERRRIAKRLMDLAIAYNFTETEIGEIKGLCDIRMGVRL